MAVCRALGAVSTDALNVMAAGWKSNTQFRVDTNRSKSREGSSKISRFLCHTSSVGLSWDLGSGAKQSTGHHAWQEDDTQGTSHEMSFFLLSTWLDKN